jgi:hypothetical protein
MRVPWQLAEFDGHSVTSYLRKYNLLADDYGLEDDDKIVRFTGYCETGIIAEVEALPGYADQDWERFEISLKKHIYDQDPQQLEYQVPYLCKLANQQRTTNTPGVKPYATHFGRIAKTLIREGKLSQYTACAEFMHDLIEKMQDDVQRNCRIDWDNTARLDIETLIEEIITTEDRRLQRTRLMHSTTTPENLPPVLRPTSISNAPVISAPARKTDVDTVTDMLSKFTIAMTEVMKAAVTNNNAVTNTAQPAPWHQQQYFQGQQPRFSLNSRGIEASRPGERPNSCWYCGENGHIKPRCATLANDIAGGLIHLKAGDNRIYLGRAGEIL